MLPNARYSFESVFFFFFPNSPSPLSFSHAIVCSGGTKKELDAGEKRDLIREPREKGKVAEEEKQFPEH